MAQQESHCTAGSCQYYRICDISDYKLSHLLLHKMTLNKGLNTVLLIFSNSNVFTSFWAKCFTYSAKTEKRNEKKRKYISKILYYIYKFIVLLFVLLC